MKRLFFLLLAIVLLFSSSFAEPITYNSESNTIIFDIASMPTSALKAWLEALDPSYAEYKNIETMVFKELSKRGEIAWISQFKSNNSAAQATTPTQKPSNQQINGVFVPDFQYFMETFFHHSQHVDREMSEDILENCKDGDKWIEHEGFFLYGGYDGITIRIVEGNGYLDIVKITIDKKKYKGQEDNFKAYVRAAARGLLPHESDMFFGRFFESINYDYVLESPAGYISMYTNYGVYLVTLTKSSSEISVEFSLSLYQPE